MSHLCVRYVETLTGVLYWSFDLIGNNFRAACFPSETKSGLLQIPQVDSGFGLLRKSQMLAMQAQGDLSLIKRGIAKAQSASGTQDLMSAAQRSVVGKKTSSSSLSRIEPICRIINASIELYNLSNCE